MKKLKTTISILTLAMTAQTFAAGPKNFTCTGGSDFDKVTIQSLELKDEVITLVALDLNTNQVTKKVFNQKERKGNWSTDINKPAEFISGINVENAGDSISIPRFGVYEDGLGGPVTFKLPGRIHEIVGGISCKKI